MRYGYMGGGLFGSRVASAFNRFFGARRKRGLSAKQIGREWRSKKRGRSSTSPRRRVARRRTPSTTRRTMKRKNFDLNLIDTASTVLIGSALLTTAAGGSGNPIDEVKVGAYQVALKDLAGNIRNKKVQGYVAKVAVAAILTKLVARKFKVRKIGGIKNVFSLTI